MPERALQAATARSLAAALRRLGVTAQETGEHIEAELGGELLRLTIWVAPSDPPLEARRVGLVLPIGLESERSIVGPLLGATSGCFSCYSTRRRLTPGPILRGPDGHPVFTDAEGPGPRSLPLTPFEVQELAARAVLLARQRPAHSGVWTLERATFEAVWRPVVPVPGCLQCLPLPQDRAEDVTSTWRATWSSASEPSLDRVGPEVLAQVVDDHCGLIREVVEEPSMGELHVASARIAVPPRGLHLQGVGRKLDRVAAITTAVLECLERYSAVLPSGKRTDVRARRIDLGEDALDPTTLVLHAPEDQDRGAPHGRAEAPRRVSYRHDLELAWVWGYSLSRARPLLVPEQCVYHRLPVLEGRFVEETSNGCAIRRELSGAALHALYEVVERDALMLAWYRRMQLPRLPLGAADDRVIDELVHVAEERGFALAAHDATTDLGVPVVWAIARARTPRGPVAVCMGSAAGPGLIEAARAALLELVSSIPSVEDERGRDDEASARARAFAEDPSRVRTFADHALLGGSRWILPQLGFLDGSPGRAWPTPSRPADDVPLRDLAHRLVDHGLDVLVVDTTAADVRALGLRTAKVLVPGLLPMTFGHQNRRLRGAWRLGSVEPNPHAHPFR